MDLPLPRCGQRFHLPPHNTNNALFPTVVPSKTKSSSLSSSPVEMPRSFPVIASPTRGPLVEDPYPGDDPVLEFPIEDWPLASDDDEPAPAEPPPVNAWDAAPGRMCALHHSFAHVLGLLTT